MAYLEVEYLEAAFLVEEGLEEEALQEEVDLAEAIREAVELPWWINVATEFHARIAHSHVSRPSFDWPPQVYLIVLTYLRLSA